jgi:PiT family inorganic phosphate transporter
MTAKTIKTPADSELLGNAPTSRWVKLLFAVLIIGGLGYCTQQLAGEIGSDQATPWLLLLLALFIALGFEFVNGFHDTANAVATVIYTRSMPANVAVVWSGVFNFLGVMMASGAVAWGIVSLLPVELILQVNSSAGLAMVFALLFAAIIWNLGTWWLGLPASSSHTLIGSIIGVGIANQLLAPDGSVTSGVDWGKASDVGLSLLISPLFGFVAAALLLLLLKVVARNKTLFSEPPKDKSPPLWIRSILIATCTAVSFAHGSNDGQKGMGLIMLILVGVVPTAFALNRTPDPLVLDHFRASTSAVIQALDRYVEPGVIVTDARAVVDETVRTKTWTAKSTVALKQFVANIDQQMVNYKTLANVPTDLVSNLRNDLYLAGEALKRVDKDGQMAVSPQDLETFRAYHQAVDDATRYIPGWVKIAVALALGLGTMVGWRRIVVTVGEKIGKSHLTYGQGAAAETVAAATIGVADVMGLPVSTTHVLSSGIAGTMAANGSGLQAATVRNLLLAWILTLPVSILLSGVLFAILLAVL